ncbi:hypothetical protein [Candidatus Viridilinea mediisalina]|uniref:Uncharacterized protein n=1 Tax=Candidatus Viridilinea mediisalina TaxID=2024553 RepID=A0A2A6RPR1_9CHLR|nr:hypothetical protein [Candidatus Viridilinea mediisalina]PDW04915.1 hypothetical protein CJ255_00620 [Candidatus Viridilinea mediisalina]
MIGKAEWNTETWKIKEFQIEEIQGFLDQAPDRVLSSLREQFGSHFDDIDDVDGFIYALRK